MAQVWRRWHRQWHGSVLAALRSSRWLVDVLADRKQPALSRVYGWIIDRKRRRETGHVQRIAPPHIPVFSVGNVTFGATGKTPFVQFLIDYVLKQGREDLVPLLLSRGYGGDEWRMLAKQFPACQLALGADRVAIGAAKVKELGGDTAPLSCVVLDDGLQQWRLAKDLEIVMVDALHPLGNGLLLPCGSLRERPRDALVRADVVVVHHANLLAEEELKVLMTSLKALLDPQRHPIVATSRMKVVGLIPAHTLLSEEKSDGTEAAVEIEKLPLVDRSVLIVCGVGNPESVTKVMESLARWVRVELKAFPDHHAFTSGDVDDIFERVRELRSNGSVTVVTTEKDFARSPRAMRTLADNVDLRVLRCELELQHNRDQVKERINSLLNIT
ncbi:tetraacyldisaccharide 4'-kinase [Phytophthora nicotianae INRA-310]|uniref:tetraacyldisaccharide 4'-kinase n=1 Tax=Phytophthora nicotianae (strain INRA-310) TaxID=761204 RepID=W2QR00_PHYN3|nr:tetraacyldisaccharide 4'-kinase [Phytophthora nicotianae INRA-310]ETN15627.1 tetraacyldisaccharide 4'-kinase [Phytophthora nicotianae INRA-310]